MEFGAHLKTAGGAHKAAERAGEIGADGAPDLHAEPAHVAAPRRRPRGSGALPRRAQGMWRRHRHVPRDVPDQPRRDRRRRSTRRASTRCDRRCSRPRRTRADGVVFHLGSHLGRGLDAALHQVIPALQIVLGEGNKRSRTRLLIENSAGAGNTMGLTLEDIARVIDELGRPRARRRVPRHVPPVGDRRRHPRPRARRRPRERARRADRGRPAHVPARERRRAAARRAPRCHADPGDGLIGSKLGIILGHPRLQDAAAITESPGPGPDRARQVHHGGAAPPAPGRRPPACPCLTSARQLRSARTSSRSATRAAAGQAAST